MNLKGFCSSLSLTLILVVIASVSVQRVASQNEECGISLSAPTKIVNGTTTRPGEFPWMVLMFGKSGKQTCGGSLISDRIVLTAAHCVSRYIVPTHEIFSKTENGNFLGL